MRPNQARVPAGPALPGCSRAPTGLAFAKLTERAGPESENRRNDYEISGLPRGGKPFAPIAVTETLMNSQKAKKAKARAKYPAIA